MSDLVKLSASVFKDIASSVFGIPTSAILELLAGYARRRAKEAEDILLSEIRQGVDPLVAANEDEAIAVIYRYMLAVKNGAAHRNMRLLARAIAGLARRDKLFSDEFGKYAHCLENLTRDQILVLGRLHYYKQRLRDGASSQEVWQPLIKELVPDQFETVEHLMTACVSALPSGLVLNPLDFDSTGYFTTSPLMDELVSFVDFENGLDL